MRRSSFCTISLVVFICLVITGCSESDQTGQLSATNSETSRATIAVLGHADFVPDRNAGRTGDTVGLPEILSTRIIEHLTNSKRFTPVERTALRRVILEQRFGQDIAATYLDNTLDKAISAMESVNANTVGVTGRLADYNDLLKDFQDLGSAIGADFLVLGNLEKVENSSTSTAVPFSDSNRSVKRTTVDGRLQLRVIDVKSGTILGATSIRTQISETIFKGKHSDTDQYSFYDHLGRLAATNILDLTYPAKIVSTNPLIISRGLIDGAKNGDVYAVSREGKEIRDDSNQVIARLKSPVGSVKIIDAQSTISVVAPFSGETPKVNDLAVRDSATANSGMEVARSASIPLQRRTTGQLPRLAIGLVKSGSTARTGQEAQNHTAIFTDSIISRLSQTRRFQLIDRQEVDQLLDEQMAQALAENRDMPSAMGTLAGADYLAYGNLDSSSFTSETETIQLPNSSRTFQQTKWYVSGNMRIVDARSGDILESRKITIEETPPASMDKQRIVNTLADAYANQVVLMLMNAIYPIKVAAIGQKNTVYINRGADGGLANGEVLDAFRPGKPVIDPDTGVQLGVEEVILGQITLSEVEDARSKGHAIDSAMLQVGDLLKRTTDNKNKRSSDSRTTVNTNDRSGGQIAGSVSEQANKNRKFTLAVGLLRVNSSARTTGLDSGHVKRMSDDLMLKLTNTRRFRVMERQEVDQILDEKAFEAVVSGADIISRLQELEGADYLVHGEIANFYVDTKSGDVSYLDEVEVTATAVAEGMLRLIDVHTGEVVGADKIRFSRVADNLKDPTQLMSDLMDQFTTESVTAIVLRLFPIKVLAQTGDGTVYINRGEDANLRIGAQFNVMRPGVDLIDPDTGLSFGSAESLVAQVEIISIEPSRARARIVTGSAAMTGDILRPLQVAEKQSEVRVSKPNF